MNDTLPPAWCVVCRATRVAWSKPRVDFCYDCLPGGPLTPPACVGCGSDRYFNNGLCVACHPRGPLHIETCLGCLAWGVSRKHRSRCWTCRWWKTHYATGDCICCGRHTIVSERRACRLCWEQARLHQHAGHAVDLSDATRSGGQQLFLANVQSTRHTLRSRVEPPAGRPSRAEEEHLKRALPRLSSVAHGQRFDPVPWNQLTLFASELDPSAVIALAATVDTALLRYCDEVIRDHAAAHGWSNKHTNDVRRSLRLVQVLQHSPNAKITASDVLQLPSLRENVSAQSTLDILAAAGLLIDDRTSPAERYFNTQIDGLPTAMTSQLRTWFDIMINGSTTTPRRHTIEQGLRSLFRILKGRKLVFVDPIRSMPVTDTNTSVPLPLDTGTIRTALNSPDPASALTVSEFRALKLTNIADGRLAINDRTIPSPDRCSRDSPPGSTSAPTLGRPRSTRTCSSTGALDRASHPLADRSPSATSVSPRKPCAKTGSSTKSAPPAATSDEYANCSTSASKQRCATPEYSNTSDRSDLA